MLLCENTFTVGKKHLITAKNNGEEAATAEIVVTTPFASYIEQEGKGANVEVKIREEGTQAIIAFTPTESGYYTLTVQGETLAVAGIAPYAPTDEFIDETPDGFMKNASVKAVVHKTAIRTIYFTVTANPIPAAFNVKIEKVEESKDTYTYAQVTETLTKFEKPEDKALYGVAMDGTAVLVYNETDGYYHLNAEDGPVVVVKITKALDKERFDIDDDFKDGILAYLELVDARLATYAFETSEPNADIMTIVDYSVFLRGFSEYEYDDRSNRVIPEDIETENYYAKADFVNEDGCYPLTKELRDFLEAFYTANEESFMWKVSADAAYGCEWLFPCYYYGEKENEGGDEEVDPVVGEYGFVQRIEEGEETNVGDNIFGDEVTAESYKLVVTKTSFTIYEYAPYFQSYDELFIGNWEKVSEGNYKFTTQIETQDLETYEMITVDLIYTVTFNSETGAIHFVGSNETEWKFTAINEEETADAVIGDYNFVSSVIEGETTNIGDFFPGTGEITADSYKLEVTETSFTVYTYVAFLQDYSEEFWGNWEKVSDGNYKFTTQIETQDLETYEMITIDFVYTVTLNSETGEITLVGEDDETVWVFTKAEA